MNVWNFCVEPGGAMKSSSRGCLPGAPGASLGAAEVGGLEVDADLEVAAANAWGARQASVANSSAADRRGVIGAFPGPKTRGMARHRSARARVRATGDRKSTRLNSSHLGIS